MSNEASAKAENVDYLLALTLASEEAETHPEELLALSLANEQAEAKSEGAVSANLINSNPPYCGPPNISEDLQDDNEVQIAASDIEAERSFICLGIDDYSASSEGVEVQMVNRTKQEQTPPLVGLPNANLIQVPANFWQAEDVITPEVQQNNQGENGESDHSTDYCNIDEDEDEDYAEDDDYSYPFSGDDSNQEGSKDCIQEHSDAESSGSSFEFVFQGIDSVENMTPEYIESCTSMSDIEEIRKKLIADGSKFYLVHLANKRLLTLRLKDNHNKDDDDDDDFVIITSDNNSTGRNTKTEKEPNSTTAQKTTSASATSNVIASNKQTIYPDLTPNNLRSAIVIYSREHPDDLGMPMKKLMKFFGIKKKTPAERRDNFQKIVNQQCLLETSDEIGRVLFLKEADEPCVDYKRKYDDAKEKYDDAVDEHNRYWLTVMKQIENCNSIRELQVIIDELRKANIDLPHHMTAATERMQTLSRSSIDDIKKKKKYNNANDLHDRKVVMVKIKNCNSIRELRVLMNSGIPLQHYMAAATERMRTLSMLSFEDIEDVKKKYDYANKKDNDTIAEHDRKSIMEQIENCNLDVEVKQFAMERIENCNTTRQLRAIIDELRKLHNVATSMDSIDDTDSVRDPNNIGSLTIEYIENCRNIPELFQIVNYIDQFERNGEIVHYRDGERLHDEFMYNSKTILPSRYHGLHAAATKRLSALGFESRDLSRSQAFECCAKPTSSDDANNLDQMLAMSLSLEINKEPIADTNMYPSVNFDPFWGFFRPCPPRLKISDDLGFSGFGVTSNPDPKSQTAKFTRIHLVPNFYFYDDSIPELIYFSLLTYIDPIRERRALEYIEKCNFIPELRGIIHFWEESENFGLGDSLIHSAKTRIQTILSTDPLGAVHPDYYAFDSKKSKNWLVFDSDIQLTNDVQRLIYSRNSDLEWQKGNRWLMDVVAKHYERDFNGGNGLHLFAGVIKQVKAEGRRFFRLSRHSRANKRLIWVKDDHEDVRAELLYLFQCIHKKHKKSYQSLY